MIRFLIAAALLLGGAAHARVPAPDPANFYADPGSIFTPANCTALAAAPCPDPDSAYRKILSLYDLEGRTPILWLKLDCGSGPPAVYTTTTTFLGSPVGAYGGYVIVKGCDSNPDLVVLKPVSGYGAGVNGGPAIRFSGLVFDARDSLKDSLACGDGGTRVVIGYSVVFGWQLPQNHITAGFGCAVYFDSTYTVRAESVYKTATFTTDGWLSIGSTTGVLPFMGCQGGYMPPGCHVVEVDAPNNRVRVLPVPTGSGSNGVNFWTGGQAHWYFGNLAQAYASTDGNPGLLTIKIEGYPYFYACWLYGSAGSAINIQAVNFDTTNGFHNGCSFRIKQFTTLDTNRMGVPYLPGMVFVETTATSASERCVTVGNPAGIVVGNAANGVTRVAANWSSGGQNINVASSAYLTTGLRATAPGLATGNWIAVLQASINNLIMHYGNFPAAGSNQQILFSGYGVTAGSVVESVASSTVCFDRPLQPASFSGVTVRFEGLVERAIYD